MTASLLPHIAADLDGNGLPFYAAAWDGATDETNIVWLAEPVLIPGHHWATDAATTHATFDTVGELAELLFLSGHDPLALDDAEAIAAVDRALAACHCDMTACAAAVAGEIGVHPECAGPRYELCVVRAARLLGVAP